MSNYNSYGKKMSAGYDLNEAATDNDIEEEVYGSVGNGEVGGSSSDKDTDAKSDRYHSEGELNNADEQMQPEAAPEENAAERPESSAQAGKWGSSVWKDRQPTWNLNEVEESDYYKISEQSDGNSTDNARPVADDEEAQRGQADVPEDEMLSDEYYEQDGDDASDSVHIREVSRPSISGSRLPTNAASVKRSLSRNSKTSKYDEYDYDDEDGEDDNDEDDPADADFDPGYGDKRNTRKKSKLSDSDDYDVEDEEDEEEDNEVLDTSDESDSDFDNSRRRSLRHKVPSKPKAKRERKPVISQKRRRKVESSSEEEEEEEDDDDDEDEEIDGSDTDMDQGSDDDFIETRKPPRLSRKSSVRSATVVNVNASSSELRTSSRSTRKVSYVESEESEDMDEDKSSKSQKASLNDIEEEDGDAIEKVLWHQPLGMAEDALRNNRSTQPVVLNMTISSDSDWNEVEFYIKWKGQSYLHCQWKPYSDLQNLTGFKKVLNYMKRITDERKLKKALSREETEVHDLSKEMELDLLKQYSQVERIFSDRIGKTDSDDIVPEYLVKWQGLSYADATWEKDTDIAFAQDAIDEYKEREEASAIQGKTVDFQRKKSRASLRKLDGQPEWLKGGKLRDYQLEGLNFLVNSWRNDTNVILADEMGLGKTVQSVSMVGFLQNAQEILGPFLVVVPLSTLSNWAREFKKWLPDMNVVVYVGNRASREVCQQFEFYTNKKTGRHVKFNALLTTYEVILKDKAVLSKIRWSYMMVDEAHRLKNSEASLYTSLSEFNTKNTLLITGTPLQNSVEELWALLHFLDPAKFGNKDEFVEKYKNLSSFNETELANLHKELRPHILRRVIKDVEKSLPPKIERILRVEMSPLQKQYYKWILERNFHNLNKGVRGNQVSLLNVVVELKKCCNHPFLFESADHGYGGDVNISDSNKVERIVYSSGKLVILDKLLTRLRATNHRVLIFSQMVRMLDILAEYLSLRGFQFQRLDGSTRADLRHQAMDHFNAPGSDDFCFLLSTRAGGLGINLATADTVIIFDSDWNPQNDLQAMSRAHRIGQQEVVNIYRFVTSRSVEEDILERAKKKMVLDHLVIQKMNAEGRLEKKETKKGASMFDKNELSAILRFGAEELFKEEKNDEDSKNRLESMDIDEILERAEKVEQKTADVEPGNELLGAFKVANFCSTEDDQTFWSRLIQLDAVDQAEEALAPRAARNIKSYAENSQIEKATKKRKRGGDSRDRVQKNSARAADFPMHSLPIIDGACAQVRRWSYGNLTKKDASHFVRAVKKFGIETHISSIAAEVGGLVEAAPHDSQIELFDSLMEGCREAVGEGTVGSKGAILDFFGVSVKAKELLDRYEQLILLAKRIKRYKDPVKQFRLVTQHKSPQWAKGCGWNQVDDARLLLGIYYYGFGNWEKIRTDSSLNLTRKIAPATLGEGETFLPRAPNLDNRATNLLQKEFASVTSKNSKVKRPSRDEDDVKKKPKTRTKDVQLKSVPSKTSSKKGKELTKKQQKEAQAKEEGEVSGSENERYQQFKEEKWMEWCSERMEEEQLTLKRLEKLQTTSVALPKEKVLAKIRKYLQQLGRKIDMIVQEEEEPRKYHRTTMRLWNYVSTFSNLSGEKLFEIYAKLKEEQPHFSHHRPHGNDVYNKRSAQKIPSQFSETLHKSQTAGKSDAWKRRRRSDLDNQSQSQAYSQPSTLSNGNRTHEPPSTAGILGSAPPEFRRFVNERSSRGHQMRFPSGQGYKPDMK